MTDAPPLAPAPLASPPLAPSPLRSALERIDAEVMRYAPPQLRESELLARIGRLLDLCHRFQREYPGLKAALQGHADIGQSCRIVHAAALIDYFAGRLEAVCEPLIRAAVGPDAAPAAPAARELSQVIP